MSACLVDIGLSCHSVLCQDHAWEGTEGREVNGFICKIIIIIMLGNMAWAHQTNIVTPQVMVKIHYAATESVFAFLAT